MAANDFPKLTSLDVIDRELERLHKELGSFLETKDQYLDVLEEVRRVNTFMFEMARKEHSAV